MNIFVKNIIEKIKIIESSPVYINKYMGDGLYYIYTKEVDDFLLIAEVKILIMDLVKRYNINKVIKLFKEQGYEIKFKPLSNLDNSGYINTEKGIITFYIENNKPKIFGLI